MSQQPDGVGVRAEEIGAQFDCLPLTASPREIRAWLVNEIATALRTVEAETWTAAAKEIRKINPEEQPSDDLLTLHDLFLLRASGQARQARA